MNRFPRGGGDLGTVCSRPPRNPTGGGEFCAYLVGCHDGGSAANAALSVCVSEATSGVLSDCGDSELSEDSHDADDGFTLLGWKCRC